MRTVPQRMRDPAPERMTTAMTQSMHVEQAAARLLEAGQVLILCHKNPDGDTIGCGAALCHVLNGMGRQAAVLCADPIPPRLSFTRPRLFRGEFVPDLVVAVDVAGVALLGDAGLMPAYSRHVDLCIDHHAGNGGYADCTLLDASAAAAAELLWEVLQAMGAEITPAGGRLPVHRPCHRHRLLPLCQHHRPHPPGGRRPDRGRGPGGGAEHHPVRHPEPGPDGGRADRPQPPDLRAGGPVRRHLAGPGRDGRQRRRPPPTWTS